MACRLRIVALTGLGLLASACAQKSETALPAIGASAAHSDEGVAAKSRCGGALSGRAAPWTCCNPGNPHYVHGRVCKKRLTEGGTVHG